jgi:hypothetical protein
LHDSGFGEGVGADEFVVGRMEGHDDDTDFAGDAFGAPAEVTRVETQGAIFGVAAANADEMDAFVTDTGVGWLATFLEGSVDVLGVVLRLMAGFCSPLLAVVGAFGT